MTKLTFKQFEKNRAILKPLFWHYLLYVERYKHCKLGQFSLNGVDQLHKE